MNNYYKYLPVSTEDKKWGLHVLNTGCNRVAGKKTYPAAGHPAGYDFRWETGRVLHEFQVIYISKGSGVFESKSGGQLPVKEGSVILLFPYEWHRYKPDTAAGWDEWWVGCKGPSLNTLISKQFFSKTRPVLHIGIQAPVILLYSDIIEQAKQEKPGYQPLIAGAVMHLLGQVHAAVRQEKITGEDVQEEIIHKATAYMRSRLRDEISFEALAQELRVSYSWFRKAFKLYTGMPPHQYLLELRLEKARQLLSGQKAVKEIAFEAGFESAFYFSRLFKKKMGLSPEAFRKQLHV